MSACLEAHWLEQARHGDNHAFGHLLECYQTPVYNLAYRLLGPSDAEDAAQETFLRAFAHLDSYHPEQSFRTWLLSITAHICIDQLRHLGRLHIESLGARDPVSKSPDPERETLAHEREGEVRYLLATLPPQSRQLIDLHYWQDMSYRDIGQRLGLTESAVKSRLHRVRRQLAHRLDDNAAWDEGHAARSAA
jgi:RNA polymerase sigma-70 factor, ECF subfamily